ncbi:MAG: hypothetical protein AAGU77_11740 [Bacillota bacterium]
MHNNKDDQQQNDALYGVVDERTTAVVYQGDAYTGRFMLFAVLLDVFLRGLKWDSPFINANWDLMLIVLIGSLISVAYQIKNKVLFNRPLSRSILFLAIVAGIGAVIAFVFSHVLPR